jgi:Tfp pilus assembly protein PilX
VTDQDDAAGCTYLDEVLLDWRGSTAAIEGLEIDAFGGSAFADVGAGLQPRVVVEERYVAPLDFEAAAAGRGIHYYTATAIGTGPAGQSERILQTTIAKVYAW